MFWNRRKKEQPLLPAPEKTARFPQGLLEPFSDAAFGSTCRTGSFHLADRDDAPVIWRKAVRVGSNPNGKKWNVIEIKEQAFQHIDPTRPVEMPTNEVKEIESGLSFFEAIESLSLFEQSPFPEQKHVGLNPNGENLGDLYFKTFAMREGIIFDLAGQPFPTADGEVITGGNFAQEDMAKLKEQMKKQSERLSACDKSIIEGLITQDEPHISLEKLKSMHNIRSSVKQVANTLRVYAHLLRLNMACDFEYLAFNEKEFTDKTGADCSVVEREWSSSRKYHLKVDHPGISEHLQMDIVSVDKGTSGLARTRKIQNAYIPALEKIMDNLHTHCEREIRQLRGHKELNDLQEMLKKELEEITFIAQLAVGKNNAIQCRNMSPDKVSRSLALSELSTKKNSLSEHYKAAGAKHKHPHELETSLLNGKKLEPALIPWSRYDDLADKLERMAVQYEKDIKREWRGGGIKIFI